VDRIAHVIAGRSAPGTSGRTAPVYDPATGAVMADVDLASADEVDAAVAAAVAAQRSWRDSTLGERAHLLFAVREGVVRREADGMRRYVHIGTGNYNSRTARLYTDVALFTCSPSIGADVSDLFNSLTGISRQRLYRKLLVAPANMKERFIELIEREARHASAGRRARIVGKMNALVDPDVIDALYRASQAGVEIDLIVRGICCLRPGLPGVSENIRVRSIVDRFLEHSRIFVFGAAEPEVFLSSADWMPRNFHRRVEVMFPVEEPALRTRVVDEILGAALADDMKAHQLGPDGQYTRVPREVGVRSQQLLADLARRPGEPPMLRVVPGERVRRGA
jgi:polyphosphate kinase